MGSKYLMSFIYLYSQHPVEQGSGLFPFFSCGDEKPDRLWCGFMRKQRCLDAASPNADTSTPPA